MKLIYFFVWLLIDTHKMFLGVMIGDFTRTGISTMINTGSYFGLGANIYTGIGPLSFILAQSLTKSTNDITENFNFQLGTSF